MAIEVGQQLLHYRLIEKIGEGGMGIVWKAEDTRLRRHVALKFVLEESARHAQAVERQVREARAASALNHPNICAIHDIGEWNGRHFIVMELVEGRSLQQHIGDRPMDVDSAIDLAIQISDALAAAHGKGIIHRDVKPANIMVIGDGVNAPCAKMLDFGLAKLSTTPELEPGDGDEIETALAMTATGAVVGTVSYMSPEQALGKQVDHRTDIFSLGVLIYEMITARRPFEGSTSAAVFDAILNRSPTALLTLNVEVPAELEKIVTKALEKDPALRYQSAADLCADLKRLRRDSSADRVAEAPPAVPRRPGRRWVWASGAVIALLVGVLTTMKQQRSSQSETTPPTSTPDKHAESRAAAASTRGPSIAVLPFTNASKDPNQEYFSDGLTEDIITELARYNELSVIPRLSTARFKNSETDIREIGTSLDARYVLQGTVRKAGDRIRVGVQLSDSSLGRSIWGKSYERDLTAQDLFELQDELTQQVVNAIAGSYGALVRAELPNARHKPPASLESYDCVLRTYEYLQIHSAANHLAARDCLEHVVEADPAYAEGKAWLAYLYADQHHHRWNEEPDRYDALVRALSLAEEAVRLDAANHVSHGALMVTHFLRGDYEQGKIEADRTIDLSPNNALWLALAGTYLSQREDFEHGLPMVHRAIALSPHPPPWYGMAGFYNLYHHGRYAEALKEATALNMVEDFREPLFVVASCGQLGRPDGARRGLEELKRLWPRPVGELRQELIERHALSPALADHLMEGLAKAGLSVEPDNDR